jgi:hypothetical protein
VIWYVSLLLTCGLCLLWRGLGLWVLRYVLEESDWKLGFLLSLLYAAPLSYSFVTLSSSSPAETVARFLHLRLVISFEPRHAGDWEIQRNQYRKEEGTETPALLFAIVHSRALHY